MEVEVAEEEEAGGDGMADGDGEAPEVDPEAPEPEAPEPEAEEGTPEEEQPAEEDEDMD